MAAEPIVHSITGQNDTKLVQQLLNEYQHDFPLSATPYADMADRLGISEQRVIDLLSDLKQQNILSRVGAVFRPNRVGASTLAAMAVPEHRLDEIAGIISSYSAVNHNYEREHHFNLWFVATAENNQQLASILEDMEAQTEIRILSLPMEKDYHIDLGFPLQLIQGGIMINERELIAALQHGLPLVSHPYAVIAEQIGSSEDEVINYIQLMREKGDIKRFGIVVHHRQLGYKANAMVVWDIPDDRVDELGECFGQFDFVTLSYRRPRRLPDWPYNLFCMIHGKDRDDVLKNLELMTQHCNVTNIRHEPLFSNRCFKQRGAIYIHNRDEQKAVKA